MSEHQYFLVALSEAEDHHGPLAVNCNAEGRWATMDPGHFRDECGEEVSRNLSGEEVRFELERYNGHLREPENQSTLMRENSL